MARLAGEAAHARRCRQGARHHPGTAPDEVGGRDRFRRAPAPRLHPTLAEIYRRKVADLVDALGQEDGAEARELVRGLVEHVTVHPEGEHSRVEVRGELAPITALPGGTNDKRPDVGGVEALSEQIKVVAGTCNHRQFAICVAV